MDRNLPLRILKSLRFRFRVSGGVLHVRYYLQADRVRQIINEVRATALSPSLSFSAVARNLGISVSTGQRSLKSAQLSFRQILCLARLAAAEELLLREPASKVEVISLSVGWRSKRSLYLAVWRNYGCCLSEWRRNVYKARGAGDILDDYSLTAP